MKCPHCQNESKQVKVGFNSSGSQRYLCQICKRKYTPDPLKIGYENCIRQQAIEMHRKGLNQRQVAKTFGVSQGSISNWVRANNGVQSN